MHFVRFKRLPLHIYHLNLGQDFNDSKGLCGNFNGLRDDDISFVNPILEDIPKKFSNPKRSQCIDSFHNEQAKINHMISTDKLGMIEDFKRPEILMNHNARFD